MAYTSTQNNNNPGRKYHPPQAKGIKMDKTAGQIIGEVLGALLALATKAAIVCYVAKWILF